MIFDDYNWPGFILGAVATLAILAAIGLIIYIALTLMRMWDNHNKRWLVLLIALLFVVLIGGFSGAVSETW